MTKFSKQIMIYESGSRCLIYNKQYTANVQIECSSNEGFAIKEKINACHYNFVYSTKIGCNSLKLESILNRIKDLLSNVN